MCHDVLDCPVVRGLNITAFGDSRPAPWEPTDIWMECTVCDLVEHVMVTMLIGMHGVPC